jgi:signal-transduction protein with cAMP-binding, CBS, and nucleotidyltransferase domain
VQVSGVAPLHSQTEIFRRIVRNYMGAVPEVARSATVAEAVNSMAQMGAAAVIVTDPDRKPAGIITQQDVVRRIAWRATPDQSVETVMSTPVATIAADDHLFNAICAMRRYSLRHIAVVDGAGRLAGLLPLHEALLVLSGISVRLIDRFTQDESVEGLKRLKEAEIELAKELFRDDVPISQVQAVLAEIDADLHRQAIVRAITEMAADGWGGPPVPFALIIMGSGGRGESFLKPDQDNGFILADYDDAEHARIEAYFAPLAERFTRLLDTIGFPLCLGNVMATNPVWRKRISEWHKQIALWLRTRTETQLLLSDVLFDFRHVWGEPALSDALRRHLAQAVAQNPTFIRDLFTIEAHHTAALGWFGRIRSERDEQDRPGMINLKLRGTLPLVEAARLLSLRAGVPATSTLGRLDGLLAKGALHPDDHDYLRDGFEFISRLLLRQQIEELEAGRQINNFVPEARLTKREKDHLVICFRAIVNVREAMKAELTGSTL